MICRWTCTRLWGSILLVGIVKKNAIMQIDFALDAERRLGLSPREAIFQGCVTRFRPIMMTTMAALLGAAPIAAGQGAGGEVRRPLGYVHYRRAGVFATHHLVFNADGVSVPGEIPIAQQRSAAGVFGGRRSICAHGRLTGPSGEVQGHPQSASMGVRRSEKWK